MNNPFLLRPSGKDYLWGGKRLNDEFEKNIDLTPLAETWECSTHPDGPCYVASGVYKDLKLADVIKNKPDFLGQRYKGLSELPILIKFIDANQDLSIQVHPDDEYAQKNENGQLGKSEMWYVLDTKKDSKLVYGLNCTIDKDELKQAVLDGTVCNYVQQISVKKDDVFFIEAGTIHALGAGTLVAEIQENSNLTYRLYDYDRVDKHGNKRELNVEKALSVANLTEKSEPKQPIRVLRYKRGVASELLCRCRYFEVFRMIVNTERRQHVEYYSDGMGFRVLLCVNGCGSMNYDGCSLDFYKGDCIFVPANSPIISIHGQAQFLDVRG